MKIILNMKKIGGRNRKKNIIASYDNNFETVYLSENYFYTHAERKYMSDYIPVSEKEKIYTFLEKNKSICFQSCEID